MMQNHTQLKNEAESKGNDNHKDYTKFVIVSHARSGSNLLLNSLNSHYNLKAEHEIFAAHNRNIGENFEPTLNNLYGERAANIHAVGCKIFYYHLNSSEWQKMSKIPNLKVIHLKRKNRLSMIVSMKVAFKTSQWGITEESERIDASEKQVYLDYDFLNNSFANIKKWEEETEKMFDPANICNIYYEELTSKYAETVTSLFDFLGVNRIPVEQIKSRHKKQNPEPLSQLIQNFDELKLKFANTPWEDYFNC